MLPCEFCLELVDNDGGIDTIRFPVADAIFGGDQRRSGDSLLEMCQQRLLLLLLWSVKIGRDPWIRAAQTSLFRRDLCVW
jgi:hypothetical protein